MKYNSSQLILEALADGITAPFEILETITAAGYGASGQRIRKEAYQRELARSKRRIDREERWELKRKFDSLVCKLKKDGLMKEEKEDNGMRYELTVKGEQKLEILKSKDGFPDVWYEKGRGSKVIIVMFDIPEDQKRKRTWLRMVLNNLDFKMAQKSVWIGKTKIPKELMADLMRMGMEDFVEIFEVGSTGNLKNIL